MIIPKNVSSSGSLSFRGYAIVITAILFPSQRLSANSVTQNPNSLASSLGQTVERSSKFGTADDTQAFQAALDDAEARGQPLFLAPGSIINLHGTIYIGNVEIKAKGSTINVLLDGHFVLRGNSLRKGEGAILTKASPGAGYPLRTVRISFDELSINTVRTSDAPGPKTGLFLENVSAFKGDVLRATARGTGKSEVNPIDFFSGVQGVKIGRVDAQMANPGAHGGFWIRNFSPERATSNIAIGTVRVTGASGDELFSIFNSGDPRADVHDVSIGEVIAQPSGGGGMGVSIYRNANDHALGKMRNITIGKVQIDVGDIGPLADSTGGFALKVQRCYANIGAASIRYYGRWTPALPWVFGIRYAPGIGETRPLFIPTIQVTVEGRNRVPPHSAAMLFGPISTNRLVVRGAGSGFRNVVFGKGDLRGIDIQSSAFSDHAVVRATP